MSKRFPQYEPGARWRCERSILPFTFVIVGPGSKSDRKLCRVEYDREDQYNRNFETEFTHRHLKEYAVYQEKK